VAHRNDNGCSVVRKKERGIWVCAARCFLKIGGRRGEGGPIERDQYLVCLIWVSSVEEEGTRRGTSLIPHDCQNRARSSFDLSSLSLLFFFANVSSFEGSLGRRGRR
jgi:hypothetical protein